MGDMENIEDMGDMENIEDIEEIEDMEDMENLVISSIYSNHIFLSLPNRSIELFNLFVLFYPSILWKEK